MLTDRYRIGSHSRDHGHGRAGRDRRPLGKRDGAARVKSDVHPDPVRGLPGRGRPHGRRVHRPRRQLYLRQRPGGSHPFGYLRPRNVHHHRHIGVRRDRVTLGSRGGGSGPEPNLHHFSGNVLRHPGRSRGRRLRGPRLLLHLHQRPGRPHPRRHLREDSLRHHRHRDRGGLHLSLGIGGRCRGRRPVLLLRPLLGLLPFRRGGGWPVPWNPARIHLCERSGFSRHRGPFRTNGLHHPRHGHGRRDHLTQRQRFCLRRGRPDLYDHAQFRLRHDGCAD